MTVMWALQFDGTMWAFGGNHPQFRSVESVEHAVRNGTLALPFWAWATGLVKISIACMLLKFQQSRKWRVFVYAIILLNIFFICWLGIANIFNCTPIASQWDTALRKKGQKCWSRSVRNATPYINLSCCVASDVILSLVPLTFLRKVRRPLREKIVIAVLMGLGIVASCFSITRIVAQKKTNLFTDPSSLAIFSGIVTCLEVQTSLIAACIPMLRSSANRWLHRIGVWRVSTHSHSYERYGPDRDTDWSNAKPGRGVIEPNQLSAGTTSFGSTRRVTWDSAHDSGQFVMDPVTGRIVQASPSKELRSGAHMHSGALAQDEWRGGPGEILVEDWDERSRGVGHAR